MKTKNMWDNNPNENELFESGNFAEMNKIYYEKKEKKDE